jgi:hypothetical protein
VLGYDPFKSQKRSGLISARSAVHSLAQRIDSLNFSAQGDEVMVKLALQMALWGNRLDLSLWPAGSSANTASLDSILASGEDYLLDDQGHRVATHLLGTDGSNELGIVVDNAGFELVTDMFMADVMLRLKVVDNVVLHTKGHPTFVSDATSQDVMQTIEWLCTSGSEDMPALQALGERWRAYVDTGRLTLRDDLYWSQPWPMWAMPEPVAQRLTLHKLCVIKGDANYRRVLGERDWPINTPFDSIVDYFPCAVCALRSLKAEIASGIDAQHAKRAAEQDPRWMVSGRWGVIQFSEKSHFA